MSDGRFYFALPRLVEALRGRSARRAERNWVEAYVPGVALFVVSYTFLAQFVSPHSVMWMVIGSCGVLFATWISWLIAVYLNSRVAALVRLAGARRLTNASAQSVIICAETTLFAAILVRRDHAGKIIGLIWLGAVSLNIIAAAILAAWRPSHHA